MRTIDSIGGQEPIDPPTDEGGMYWSVLWFNVDDAQRIYEWLQKRQMFGTDAICRSTYLYGIWTPAICVADITYRCTTHVQCDPH